MKKKPNSRVKPRLPKSTKTSARKTTTNPTSHAKRKGTSNGSSKNVSAASTQKTEQQTNLAAQLLYGSDSDEFRLINKRTNVHERIIERAEIDSEFQLRQAELKQQYEQAQSAKVKFGKWLEQGLFGPACRCTVALRKKSGRVISPLRFVIEVHVPTKISERNLQKWPASNKVTKKAAKGKLHCVPSEVDNVLTKVIESVPYKTGGLAGGFIEPSGLVRRKSTGQVSDIALDPSIKLASTELIGGIPTTAQANLNNWGTLGIAVRDTNSKTYGIINAHFASGQMVQPPRKPPTSDLAIWDIGNIPINKIFDGTVSSSGKSYYVDAALVELNNHRDLVLDLVQDFANEGFLYADDYLHYFHDHSRRSDFNQKVFKFGARTSAVKKERIEGSIDNPEDDSVENGLVIRAISRGGIAFTLVGDSGAALVAPIFDFDSNRERFLVVGICFGGIDGQKEYVFACHFAAVIKALNLQIPQDLLRKDWSYGRH